MDKLEPVQEEEDRTEEDRTEGEGEGDNTLDNSDSKVVEEVASDGGQAEADALESGKEEEDTEQSAT